MKTKTKFYRDDFVKMMAANGLLYDLAHECEPTELENLIELGYHNFRVRTNQK